MIIYPAQKNDALAIAKIHKSEIKKGFLSTLPISFLEKFYLALINSNYSFCIIAKENGQPAGFVSGITDMNKFYNYFLRKYFFYSLLLFLPKIVSFSFFKKVFETLIYPSKAKDLPKAELLTIAVDQKFQNKGVGSLMFNEFKGAMKKRDIKSFKVIVGEFLKPAIAFYEKNGFVFAKKVSVHGRDLSRVYIFNL